MHAFYRIFTRVRSSVISIKRHCLGALDKEIKMVESQIKAFEAIDLCNAQPDSNEVRSLNNKYRALLRQSNSRWAQRTRLNWIDGEDLNSSFFYKSVRLCRHYNCISSIRDAEGNNLSEKLNWKYPHWSFLDSLEEH